MSRLQGGRAALQILNPFHHFGEGGRRNECHPGRSVRRRRNTRRARIGFARKKIWRDAKHAREPEPNRERCAFRIAEFHVPDSAFGDPHLVSERRRRKAALVAQLPQPNCEGVSERLIFSRHPRERTTPWT